MFKVGDRVRNAGKWYSNEAKEGIIVSCTDAYFQVKFDNYLTLCCLDHDIVPIKEETMEVPKMYKAMLEKDGKLMSVWAEHGGNMGTVIYYKEGEVAYAPDGSIGLFVEETLEEARDMGLSNRAVKESKVVVHEVIPLATRFVDTDSSLFSSYPRYPALLIGKEVWREQAFERISKFKVGDKVVITDERAEYCGARIGMVGTVLHANNPDSIVLCLPNRGTGSNYYVCEDFLAPAPREEWVDVTADCTVMLWRNWEGTEKEDFLFCLEHKGKSVQLFGRNQPERTPSEGYKVVCSGTSALGTQWMKVFHKETE